MADVTYEDYQDLVRKLSLANERVRDLQERVSGRDAFIDALEARLAEAKRFIEMALDYEGDVFGRHHNDVVDLLLPAAPATSKGGADHG